MSKKSNRLGKRQFSKLERLQGKKEIQTQKGFLDFKDQDYVLDPRKKDKK